MIMNNLSTSPFSFTLRFFGSLLLAALFFSAKNVHAESDPLKKLMLTNNCMACHQIDKRKYGPQFDEIPAKYTNDASAVAKPKLAVPVSGARTSCRLSRKSQMLMPKPWPN